MAIERDRPMTHMSLSRKFVIGWLKQYPDEFTTIFPEWDATVEDLIKVVQEHEREYWNACKYTKPDGTCDCTRGGLFEVAK